MTDQVIETRQDCFNPATMRLNCWAPKFCEVKVVIPEAREVDVYKRQGQCAVIAAKMRGASQIVLMSRHEDRQQMALESGATAVVAERGEEGIAKVREILGGGADAALECVGTEAAVDQALGCLLYTSRCV